MTTPTVGTNKLAIRWLDVLVTAGIATAVVFLLVKPESRRNLLTPKQESTK